MKTGIDSRNTLVVRYPRARLEAFERQATLIRTRFLRMFRDWNAAFNRLAQVTGMPQVHSIESPAANEYWNQPYNRRAFMEGALSVYDPTLLELFHHATRAFHDESTPQDLAKLGYILVPGSSSDYRPLLALEVGLAVRTARGLPTIICSGRCEHNNPDIDTIGFGNSEADNYAGILIDGGWLANWIVAARYATDTNMNVGEWIDVIRRDGTSPEAVAVVTQPQHLPRVRLVAELACAFALPGTKVLGISQGRSSSFAPFAGTEDWHRELRLGFSEFFKVLYDLGRLQGKNSALRLLAERSLIPVDVSRSAAARYDSDLEYLIQAGKEHGYVRQ